MKCLPKAVALLGILAVAGFLLAANAQEKKEPEKKEVVFSSSEQAKYKELAPGASMAVISGDPDKGAYCAFTKFIPGANFDLHMHTHDMRIVVLEGAYLYKPEKGEERRVAAGSFLFVPGGDRHASGGDLKEGALFYQESNGKFDLNFADKEKEKEKEKK